MSEFSFDNMNSMYLDVLKEIGNIGAGNATTAIATMLGIAIDMKVPNVELRPVEKLGNVICDEDETIVGIFLEVELDITGSMMFLLKVPAAHYLVDKLMGGFDVGDRGGAEFAEMELSAIKEIGNIIAASYLSALASLTGLTISPSIPYISVDMAASILSVPAIMFGQFGDNALMIETEFGDDVLIDGYFILLPDEGSYDKILTSLGISV